MYFRTKTIKGTPLLQLVESYRNAEGSPRQRVVASLGDAVIPEAEKDDIAGAVTRCLRGADRGESEDWFETTLSRQTPPLGLRALSLWQGARKVGVKTSPAL
ncbi:MAG: hypothetical protein ACI8T1_001742 [Verrucomicrobiales bacterium]